MNSHISSRFVVNTLINNINDKNNDEMYEISAIDDNKSNKNVF